MAKSSNQKLKLMYLLKILEEKTDMDHGLTMPQLISKFTTGPAEVLLKEDYSLANGKVADITIIDTELEFTVDKNQFRTLSRNTPFDGRKCRGKAVGTMVGGNWVYREF